MTTAIPFGQPAELLVRQENRLIDKALDFSYDISMPAGGHDGEMEAEVIDIINEVIEKDVYRLWATTELGDIWVDAGCHIGLFSMAVLSTGTDVAALVDMDGELAWCAWQNVSALRLQLQRRGVQRSPGIVPKVGTEEIRTPEFLVEAAMLTPTDWDGKKRSCLKLDIQGAEMAVLEDGGAAKLAEAFDFMVLEWHHDDDISALLENGGWKVDAIQSHVDVLLNRPTNIIWATTG